MITAYLDHVATPKGQCGFCGKDYTKGGMSRHLSACKARAQAIEEANKATKSARPKRKPETIFHLRVEDAYSPLYWLHLEVPGTATFADLDSYVRRLWLECCGHLSEFVLDGVHYSSYPDDGLGLMGGMMGFVEVDMNHKLSKALSVGNTFGYTYDFGTSSELTFKVISQRKGMSLSPKQNSIYQMVRNHPPKVMCLNCEKREATSVCVYCVWNPAEKGWLCSECESDHACVKEEGAEFALLPVVNSPRTGMCGYVGDAGLTV